MKQKQRQLKRRDWKEITRLMVQIDSRDWGTIRTLIDAWRTIGQGQDRRTAQ
jgi:hypothetical protein